MQDSPRLGGRILRHYFEATASRLWAQDLASPHRTTDSLRLRRTSQARDSRRGSPLYFQTGVAQARLRMPQMPHQVDPGARVLIFIRVTDVVSL